MRTVFVVFALSVAAAPVLAQPAPEPAMAPHGDVCIAIDEHRDTLSPHDRASAILLLARQFELAGQRVGAEGCAVPYTLWHIKLGETIFVTLSGANQTREGTALGLDDLPALYSQMVRSLVTGRPMTGFNVVDRTNVTTAQARTTRVQGERYAYARLGYGAVLGDRAYGTPSFGFGYRIEHDSFGVDVSFLNLQAASSSYGSSGGVAAGSLVKLQGLYFLRPEANASPYFGGGLSWGGTTLHSGSEGYGGDTYSSGWNGSGLQGEVTVGYELPRASTFRFFVEGNVVLPFYRVASETYTYTYSSPTGARSTSPVGEISTTVASRYAPSVIVSMGIGWDRSRGRR